MNEERPSSISIDLRYDRDGRLDASALLIALEGQLEGRIKILDWYDENFAAADYPHLNDEQRRSLIWNIETGDYDEIINQDGKRSVLDEAAARAEVPAWEDQDENDDESDLPTP